MKIRNGFVSNSSTSSFICNICSEEFSGWDATPYDSDYACYVCPNQHVFCESHLKDFGLAWQEDNDGNGTISSSSCPICLLLTYSNPEMVKYLEKTRSVTKDEVFAEVKSKNKRRRKLYDEEYISYVCEKNELTDEIIMKEIKEKFETYEKYSEFINAE